MCSDDPTHGFSVEVSRRVTQANVVTNPAAGWSTAVTFTEAERSDTVPSCDPATL